MQSLVSARPSVGPYWSAFAHDSCAMRCATAANVSGGKLLVSGRPPASEITSGRAVTAIRSRIADDFMTCVREAKRPAYRSRSRLVERGRPRRGPSSTVTALQGTERLAAISLFFDIGQGAGLASASGVRPFLPPILAGVARPRGPRRELLGRRLRLPRVDPVHRRARRAGARLVRGERPAAAARPASAIALGALLFAGSLTEGGRDGWIGLPLGAACAALAWYASARFFARARARLDSDGGAARRRTAT